MSTRVLSAVVVTAWAFAFSQPVAAQWAWKDDNGRLVYSDRQPPSSVKPDQVVRQPRVSGSMIDPSSAMNSVASAEPEKKAGAPTGPQTYAEREQEFRKRLIERTQAEKKQADEVIQRQQSAQECERSKGYLRSLEEGARIQRTDTQGNREFLDDQQRAAEVARMREQVTRSCAV